MSEKNPKPETQYNQNQKLLNIETGIAMESLFLVNAVSFMFLVKTIIEQFV